MADLNPIHPLAVFEEHDFGNGEQEPVANSWGSASVLSFCLLEQGADGPAAECITAMLANAGFAEAETTELIQQVLVKSEQSQGQLRLLQQQIAETIHNDCEQAFGQEGPR